MTAAPPPSSSGEWPPRSRAGGPADWGPPTGGWVAAPPPPGPWPGSPAPPASPGRSGLVLAALGGALAGAVLTAVVGGVLGLVAAREVGQGVVEELDGGMGWSTEEGSGGWPVEPGSSGSVGQSAPVVPGDLGPDPVLDAYAQSCFDGALQACDDLFFYASPMSAYEEYGGTCGGRVEMRAVYACTELE